MLRSLLALALLASSLPALAGDDGRRSALPRLGLASSRSALVAQAPAPAASRQSSLVEEPEGELRRQGPVCPPEVCQLQASAMPDSGPLYRASRTDLVLGILSRAPIPALSTVAGYIANANLRVDFRPGEPGGTPGARGWGKVMVTLRWKLDAENRPHD
ncbi:conserved hypothetical protein [Anaeromyxobacter dehalogenans 2CP-1]|uniref:Uncharacterized protein n=1 Tax=Anaeromyxobacter dehalogenans (strain ATCC BAA-258 / DSM 21875 / 2CP-1) TaxID=455488 RepID=B8J749_ANAD2|nr:hypothetical protein [Anaeromyxobacter dehalogenans]ACL65239.1 conserved hypothetical protein [Anaeromyxobacter dehalogenans 2CP-1]